MSNELIKQMCNEFNTYCGQFDNMCTNCKYGLITFGKDCEIKFTIERLIELGKIKVGNEQTMSMEKDFNIEENQIYLITFKSENLGEAHSVCVGEILNFDCNQFTIKGEDGLYIIQRQNVIEMIPSRKGENKNEKC